MGSAVSAVTSAVGGIAGAAGGVVGSAAGAMTPQIQVADQAKLNEQIAALQANSGSYQNTSNQLMGQANNQLGQTQASIGQANGVLGGAQNALNGAQNANQVVGGDALSILRNAATGGAPSAAQAQLQSGKDQAIATQQAMANSGNLSQMIGGQKTAMDNAAHLTQSAANEAAQLRATEMGTARGQYGQQAGQFASQAGTNAALATGNANVASGLAGLNANIYGNQLGASGNFANLGNQATTNAGNLAAGGIGMTQGVSTANAQNQVQATGGLLNGVGAAAMMMSDENVKENIQSDRGARAHGISEFFKDENKKPESKAEEPNGPKKFGGYADDDPRKKAANDISSGFLSSDEKAKGDVRKDSMLHSFLSKLDPVTFEYKESDGKMGRTPGIHMGILAQDVEKAPGGASMVKETPEGKAIDLASAVGMLMSAAADSHERVSSLEELFKSKKGTKK